MRRNKVSWMDSAAEAVIAVTTVGAVAMAMVGPHDAGEGVRYREAMAQYEAGRWPEAFEALGALADDGDAPAARVAAMMAHQGPVLFGQRFDLDPQRMARWDLAMRGGARSIGARDAHAGETRRLAAVAEAEPLDRAGMPVEP